ncbi:MAG: exosortase F-associated protein [Ulvibacter sp.]|jgi:exosortase F-associated protein
MKPGMNRITKTIIVVFLVGILVLIRGFEEALFYDPLIPFFKSIQSYESLPQFETLKLLVNIAMRFLLNTAVSLGVLWVIFQNRDVVRLSGLLYSVLFIVLFAVFCYLLVLKTAPVGSMEKASEPDNFMDIFYVRRFLIQPLFLLILIPAFYFQKKN